MEAKTPNPHISSGIHLDPNHALRLVGTIRADASAFRPPRLPAQPMSLFTQHLLSELRDAVERVDHNTLRLRQQLQELADEAESFITTVRDHDAQLGHTLTRLLPGDHS